MPVGWCARRRGGVDFPVFVKVKLDLEMIYVAIEVDKRPQIIIFSLIFILLRVCLVKNKTQPPQSTIHRGVNDSSQDHLI